MTSLRGRHRARAFLAPEVVQTSAMDCGPASLKCLLEGFGIPASYARLQEACQTDVDGTSINTIEQIAVALGLEAEQVMLPLDHVLLEASTALPALVVVRRENVTHFLIAWRRQGPFVQVMDPAKGRRWLRVSAFEQELYRHAQPVPASAWREWAGDEEFAGGLRERLAALKVPTASRQRLIDAATADASWRGLAMLDASTRMVADLVRAGGVARGRSASALIEACIDRMLEGHEVNAVVPAQYWSVFPSSDDEERVTLGGAVLLRIQGRRPSVTTAADDPSGAPSAPLPPSLTRALEDAGERPMRQLWRLLRRDSPLMPSMLGAAVGLSPWAPWSNCCCFAAFWKFTMFWPCASTAWWRLGSCSRSWPRCCSSKRRYRPGCCRSGGVSRRDCAPRCSTSCRALAISSSGAGSCPTWRIALTPSTRCAPSPISARPSAASGCSSR
jgi:predicted double-glycine peptidase